MRRSKLVRFFVYLFFVRAPTSELSLSAWPHAATRPPPFDLPAGAASIGLGALAILALLCAAVGSFASARARAKAAKPSGPVQAATLLASSVALILVCTSAGLCGAAAFSVAQQMNVVLTEANTGEVSTPSPPVPAAGIGLAVAAALLAAGALALDFGVFCLVRPEVRRVGTRAQGDDIVVNPVPVRKAGRAAQSDAAPPPRRSSSRGSMR